MDPTFVGDLNGGDCQVFVCLVFDLMGFIPMENLLVVPTWRIIPGLVSDWEPAFISAIKRPFGRGTILLGGLRITMVNKHLLNGMILQVKHRHPSNPVL